MLMWLKYCTRQLSAYSESFWPLSTLLAQACFSINTQQRDHNKDLVRDIVWDCQSTVLWVHYMEDFTAPKKKEDVISSLQLQDEGLSVNSVLDAFGSVFL